MYNNKKGAKRKRTYYNRRKTDNIKRAEFRKDTIKKK